MSSACDQLVRVGRFTVTAEIDSALKNGAAMCAMTSAGKDSLAMTIDAQKAAHARGWNGPRYLVHNDLGLAEWEQSAGLAKQHAERYGYKFVLLRHAKGGLLDGIEAKLERDRARGKDIPPFPSSKARWCTSDFKRGVTDKWIRNTFPCDASVVCMMGLRAAESGARAKKPYAALRKTACAPTKGRVVWDSHPILDYSIDEVWRAAGESRKRLAELQQQVTEFSKTHSDEETMRYAERLPFNGHVAYLY